MPAPNITTTMVDSLASLPSNVEVEELTESVDQVSMCCPWLDGLMYQPDIPAISGGVEITGALQETKEVETQDFESLACYCVLSLGNDRTGLTPWMDRPCIHMTLDMFA